MDLIIFDFDGVIADSLHHIHNIFNILADRHGFRHIDSDEHFQDLANDNIIEMIRKLGIPKLSLPGIFLEYKQMMEEIHDQIHLFPGMDVVIKDLAKKNTLVIISSNHEDIIRYVLERYRIADLFYQVIGSEFSFHKQHKLKHILRKLKPENAFFVTDTESDIADAKGVEGLTTIGVRWGYHTWSEKDKHKPDMMAERPEDIISLVSSRT